MALAGAGLVVVNRFYLTGERFTLLHMMELAGVLQWSPLPPPPLGLPPRELELRSLLAVELHTLTRGQAGPGRARDTLGNNQFPPWPG